MTKPYILSIIWIIFLPVAALAQATVKAELSGSEMMIGDQVNLQIRVTQAAKAQVDINLDSLAAVEGLEIVNESDPIRKEDPGINYLEKNITLTSFDAGTYTVPPIPVTVFYENGQEESLLTNATSLTVRTIPMNPDSVQLAPIKDIYREKFQFRDAIPYLLGVVGVIVIGFGIWWFFIRKEEAKQVVVPTIYRPVHEIALEKLDLLQKQELWQKGQVKEYYTQLTFIAREYLENRYRIPALESTTGEILRKMNELEETDRQLSQQLQRILTASDMVKFAKARPASEFHTEAMTATRSFIETTKDEEAPPVPVSADRPLVPLRGIGVPAPERGITPANEEQLKDE